MYKIKANVRNATIGDFIIKVRDIQVHLNDPMFSNVTPSSSEVAPLVDQLESLQAQINFGYTGLIVQRNELRRTVNALLVRQCASVNALAGGDLIILQASGFDLCKEPEARPIPERVKNVTASNGFNSGEVQIGYGPTKYSVSYVIQMRMSGGEWANVQTTTKRKLVIGAVPEKEYAYFRVAGVNSNGIGEWSTPVRVLVGR